MGDSLFIFMNSMLVNNPLVVLFLGLCSFVGVSKKINEAASMGIAVILVTFISQQITFVLNYPLEYFAVEYLRLMVFISVVASLVQIMDIVMKKSLRGIHQLFGIYLALITTNCLVLYVCIAQVNKGYTYFESTALGLGTGCGYLLMMVIMAGIREHLEYSDPPEFVKGTPLILLIAGILSLMIQGSA